jgi:hypothetical protein
MYLGLGFKSRVLYAHGVMVLGSASLEVTTVKVYSSGTGASVRSVIVVFWPCGIALVSGRRSNTR